MWKTMISVCGKKLGGGFANTTHRIDLLLKNQPTLITSDSENIGVEGSTTLPNLIVIA